jgi:signal peptide peptidase SppA
LSQKIHNFFQGSLFVSESYLDALIPLYFQSVTSGQTNDSKTVLELETANLSFMDNQSSDANKIENANKVLVLNFIGPVVKYADWWMDMLGTQDYIRIMDRYKSDPSIAGVVMNVDSGGGQKYGTPEFYDYIKSFSEVKPVVIYTGGLLCSGSYYFAAPASFIIANKRADAIGSIGIYTEIFDWNGYYESMGLKVHTIYSDLSTEKNKSHRDVLSGADKNYKNYISKELNPDGQKFIDDMKLARPQIKEEVFKGGTWDGEEAVSMGLADANGTLQDAIDKVYELYAATKSPDNTGNSNNNNNQNKNKSMSKIKSFPSIQKIIGVEGAGLKVVTKTLSGVSGVFVTEAQLDALEKVSADNEAAITAANTKVTTAETAVTALEGVINRAVKTAGLEKAVEAAATTESKVTLLGAKVAEYGKRSGAIITKPKAEGDSFEEADSIVNAADSHNEYYNKA